MSIPIEDRPAEQVKDEAIDILIYNFSHGFIADAAFERRLDNVMQATSNTEMLEHVSDLQTPPDDVLKAQKHKQFSVNYSDDHVSPTETIYNILSSNERRGVWNVPKEIKVYTILGSSVIDFTHARFSSSNVTVKIVSVLGSDTFFVPEQVNVTTKTVAVLASLANKAPNIAPHNAPTITVEGLSVLGDISIKVKKQMKEQFVAFANQMKTLFGVDNKG